MTFQYVAVSSTRAGRVLFFDYSTIESFVLQSIPVIPFAEAYIGKHGIEKPRGLRSYLAPMPNIKALRVTGFDELVTMVPSGSRENFSVLEMLQVSSGGNNHDIRSPGDIVNGEQVISAGRGAVRTIVPRTPRKEKERLIRAARVAKIKRDDEGRLIVPFDREKSLMNTELKPGFFTVISRGRNDDNSRVIEFDGVYIKNVFQEYPKDQPNSFGQWRQPHHVFKYKKRWFVANSGAGELVNLTNKKVYKVGGFPRGLIRGPRGTLIFTKTCHREDKEQEWATLACGIIRPDNEFEVLSEIVLEGYKDAYQGAVL